MTRHEEFATLVKRLTSGKSARAVAREVGISHTAIYDMMEGFVPSYRLLERFSAGLGLDPIQRMGLFQAAGYGGEMKETPVVSDPVLAGILETSRMLKPEQRNLVLQLARGLAGGVRQPAA